MFCRPLDGGCDHPDGNPALKVWWFPLASNQDLSGYEPGSLPLEIGNHVCLASVAALHQAGETTCDRADLHGTHGRTRTDISRRRFNRQSYMGMYGPKSSGHAAGLCPALPASRKLQCGVGRPYLSCTGIRTGRTMWAAAWLGESEKRYIKNPRKKERFCRRP